MASKKPKSKKPSSTKKSYGEQLKDVVFFVDRSSGRYDLVNGLRSLDLTIESHDDHFAPNTPDVEWIMQCGKKGWIIVSSDKNIKKNVLEKRAIFSSQVAAFFFTSASISSTEQIFAFTSALRKISNLVLNQTRPFIARISPDGSVELWMNHKGDDLIAQKVEQKRNLKIR